MSTTVRRATSVTALAVAAVGFLWWYGNRHNYYDLRIYVHAMEWWAAGNRLYDYAQPDPVQGLLYFTYPPFAALLLWPFGQIPIGLTIVIFAAGTVILYAITTWWLLAPVVDRHGWRPWLAAGIALPLIYTLEPTRETVTFGQLNMVLIALILRDMLFAVPRNSRWAGVGIGLATAIKLFPGIFILYLVVTRRWRAALTSTAVAAGATLVAAAVAPRDSWQFWTDSLWATERVGRADYTANQSLLGLLSRAVAPDEPNRLIWLPIAFVVAVFGLWRAARAENLTAALAITGLVGGLISPITWPHHLYWFIPAIIVLVDASVRQRAWLALAALAFAVNVLGVVSFGLWSHVDHNREPTDSVVGFLGRNSYVLLAVVLLAVLPIHVRDRAALPSSRSGTR